VEKNLFLKNLKDANLVTVDITIIDKVFLKRYERKLKVDFIVKRQ